MSKIRSSHLSFSSDDDDSSPLTHSQTTTKPTAIKKTIKKLSTPAKRGANVSLDEPSAKKGRSSQRLWTQEDEFTVLNEMVNYTAGKGMHAVSDSKGFHSFVNDKLIGVFDRNQVSGKVRKLKKKYKTLSGKKTLTPHEKKLVKLSKLIWGAISDTNSVKKADAEEDAENDDAEDDAKEDADAAEDVTSDDAVEDDDAEDVSADDAAEDDDEDAAEEDDVALEDDIAAEDEDAEVVAAEGCNKKKEWTFIGKKSIAMGLDADAVNVGLEGCSDDVKVEIEKEWEQYHLEEAALFQKKLKLVLKESDCVVKGLEK